jgi:hypothetical protein
MSFGDIGRIFRILGANTVKTFDSRSALSRARFFLAKANAVLPDQRMEFEAFLEASIIFGRTAVHRFQTRHSKHPEWNEWWDSLDADPTMLFFRNERNFILKHGPLKIGQKIGMPSIGPRGGDIQAQPIASASELYYFDDPSIPSTVTVEQHLSILEKRIEDAAARFA